jgi:predicted AlkP superfamily phosphohydrolase/phosphomutase
MVFGVDGMDFGLTESLMRQGRLPNFLALAGQGGFLPLRPPAPPLSPVAWTNFITGTHPGRHGIFDFLRRDPAQVADGFCPQDAVCATTPPEGGNLPIPFTDYVLPPSPRQRLVRQSPPFWDLLESRGIPCVAYKVPSNFPAPPSKARTLCGLGTVDIEGTYGTFTYFSDQGVDWGRDLTGGRVVRLRVEDGVARALDERDHGDRPCLYGPANPFRRDRQSARERARAAFDLVVDRRQGSAVIELQDSAAVLTEGQWSRWLPVKFTLLPGLKVAEGTVRFYLKEAREALRLYASPINLIPGSDGLATGGLDTELLEAMGPYYTKGMSEETKALTGGILSPQEYLAQSDLVLSEYIAALEHLMGRFHEGFLFFYVSTLDMDSHVLWHHQDASHPAYDARHSPALADAVIQRYLKIDRMLGIIRRRLSASDRLYVLSDHGFAPLRREFNLPAWLARGGYLAYKDSVARRLSKCYDGIDWQQTRAYGVGLNGLCLNRSGREASGNVPDSQAQGLLAEVRAGLLALRDDDGQAVFANVYRTDELYPGPALGQGPDLILAYNRGFGPSDASVLGGWCEAILADRTGGFTGHHCMDSHLVPGVLLCSRKLTAGFGRPEDVSVSVLKDFGAAPSERMTGLPLY